MRCFGRNKELRIVCARYELFIQLIVMFKVTPKNKELYKEAKDLQDIMNKHLEQLQFDLFVLGMTYIM